MKKIEKPEIVVNPGPYRVKMEIIDNEDKTVATMTIDCDLVKALSNLHDVSALDEAYSILMEKITSKKNQ